MPRKACACGCGEWFAGRARAEYKNLDHYRNSHAIARQLRKATKAAQAVARVERITKLAGFGELSERERLLYQRAHHNGYSAGQQMGRRAGYAEALGERETALTEAQIAARRKGGLALAAKRRAA